MAVGGNNMDTTTTAKQSNGTTVTSTQQQQQQRRDFATPDDDVEEGGLSIGRDRDPEAREVTTTHNGGDVTPGGDGGNDSKEAPQCKKNDGTGTARPRLSLDHALEYSNKAGKEGGGGGDDNGQSTTRRVRYSDDDFSANPSPTAMDDGGKSSSPSRPSLVPAPQMSKRGKSSRWLRHALLGDEDATFSKGTKQSKSENTFAFLAGLCLSFNSGYINGCCMSGLMDPDGDGLRQAVSAFTGTYTRSALVLAAGEVNYFGFELSMILCFIAGAFISGMINPKAVAYQLGPTYGPTFLVGSALLIVASVMASLNPDGRSLFFFAAAANGIQNGMSSMYSGNLIRTTHLTGTSTDMGLILGQMVRGNRVNSWKFWVLLGLAVSFWLGGLISFYATTAFRGFSLLFNAVFFFLIGMGCITFVVLTNHVTVWQALSGTWQWKKALDRLATSLSAADGGQVSKEFLLDLFDRIDADGSGTIEETELFEALKASGMHVTRKGVQAMMRAADDNDDGVISKEEWRQLVMG